jgi:nucleoside-diphosphate-sugar epimerase
MIVVVTGASGLIGQSVVERLSRLHEVICVGRHPAAVGAEISDIEADLTDSTFVDRLPRRADAVVHLAQSLFYADFPDGSGDVFAVNVAAVAALLNWAKRAGVGRVIHASTGGLYGRGSRPFKEDDPLDMSGSLSFYFRTKRCAEILVEGYGEFFSVLSLRPFFVYGPRQRRSMLIPRLVDKVACGHPITIDGTDGIRLNPIHVDDVAMLIERALEPDISGVMNVAGTEIIAIRKLAMLIGDRVGRAPVFTSGESSGGDVVGDISRMSQLHAPIVSLTEGIAQLWPVWSRSAG